MMTATTELIAEARKGNFEDRGWMIDVIDRLAAALEAATAAPSDTDREALAEATFDHNAEAMGSAVRFSTASERMKRSAYEYADVVLAAGFSRSPQPVQVEVTDPSTFNDQVQAERQRQIAKGFTPEHDDKRGVDHLLMWAQEYARRGEPVKSSAMIAAAREAFLRLSAALGGGDPVACNCTQSGAHDYGGAGCESGIPQPSTDQTWREAAQIVLAEVKINGEPALEFIDRIVAATPTQPSTVTEERAGYLGERSVDAQNTLSLGVIDAPEFLVEAVGRIARERGVSRATAVRQLLAARLTPAQQEQVAEAPEVVVLCGSTRFYDEFQQANYDLTMAGKIVLSVGFYPHAKAKHGHGEGVGHDSAEKVALDELHKRKIDLADSVYVLNVGGYIGESTRGEIDYAVQIGKPITYMEPAAVTPEGEKR